jgi:hypothetical protein
VIHVCGGTVAAQKDFGDDGAPRRGCDVDFECGSWEKEKLAEITVDLYQIPRDRLVRRQRR